MPRFTERPPTPRETRRAIVVVLEQLTVPSPDNATRLDRIERIFIADLQGSKTIVAEAIDWAGRVSERRTFATVAEAKAAYMQE